ncbi:hypothetical protein BFJ63_vAg3328 [Fusarium oxysporum f. sp. narcissi]|uniref:Uncharacterized protein n=2 Tax=Fusarium oxysporum TaxID=5507 RepID=A0A4V1S215_FUSOX|nr:hypothetical protein BFJ65_g5655 [Fusarium oxysporum f. sp. cepae]RKK49403.1 hypothetical protein BFJ67_g6938 [Fusarium oxysporum f. sp. cepae]RKK61543.1 hypothetical protein BFJ66_g1279 [Fusarium oxysporum f. sp. cepae]RYC94029.1 hypothetical protein BFJ63_vAg3328 [Fusarium oxysporum f. sp. narcissi]
MLQFVSLTQIDPSANLTSDVALATLQTEAISLVKDIFGAEYCQYYDYRFRKGGKQTSSNTESSGSSLALDEPARIPHIDKTLDEGWRRIKKHLPKNLREIHPRAVASVHILIASSVR